MRVNVIKQNLYLVCCLANLWQIHTDICNQTHSKVNNFIISIYIRFNRVRSFSIHYYYRFAVLYAT